MSVQITANREDVFINQYLELTLRASLNLAGATMSAKIRKPDETETTHAVTVTNETLGYCKLTFAKNELDQAGEWEIKLYDSVDEVHGKIFRLYVNSVWQR